MSGQIGGTLTYFCRGYDFDNTPIKLNDFNAKFSFNRTQEQYSNSVIVANGKASVEKGSYSSSIRVKSDNGETAVLEHIFNRDNDKKTFSQIDYDRLVADTGKTIKINNGHAYRITATDEEKAQGIVHIELREILADKTTRTLRESITIDIETEKERSSDNSLAKSEASLAVKWKENDKNKERNIKFVGNYGFKVNGQTYTVKNGNVYNSDGKKISTLVLEEHDAYQLVGMSNFAEGAKDYTFSEKELSQARSEAGTQGVSYCNRKLSLALGSKIAGPLADQASLYYKNGVFTSEVTDVERNWWGGRPNHISKKVSIWKISF